MAMAGAGDMPSVSRDTATMGPGVGEPLAPADHLRSEGMRRAWVDGERKGRARQCALLLAQPDMQTVFAGEAIRQPGV